LCGEKDVGIMAADQVKKHPAVVEMAVVNEIEKGFSLYRLVGSERTDFRI